jgi:EH_Signature domain
VKALGAVVQQFSLQRLALPDEAPSAGMLRLLGAAEITPAPPADFLEDVRRSLVAASRSGQSSSRDLRYAPWLLWNGNPPAAHLPTLLRKLLEQASLPGRTLHRLIEAYLRDFEPNAPGINQVANTICEQLGKNGPRLDTWRSAQNEVKLFEPGIGPAALARRLLDLTLEPNAVLARYKLDDPLLATGKYMLAVEDAVRTGTPELLRKSGTTGLERVLQIVAPNGRARFDARESHTARALLRPWLDENSEPKPDLRGPVQASLLQWLGDPRLPSESQRWAAVGERETALMRRWLTRASLDLFFKLIDRHALDAQWRYRHAFWLGYLEIGAIADAWLALGSQAFNQAGAIRELGGAYGKLKGGDRGQSALLLRIGLLVISEFTHNRKLHIWPAEWRNAPQLGHHIYSRNDLAGKCLSFPSDPRTTDGSGLRHDGSNIDKWQGSAAELIKRRAGFGITPPDWHPK